MYVSSSGPSSYVSVIATSPADTKITSVTDGNGNTVQNYGSTNSTSITFHVGAISIVNPIVGFECAMYATFRSLAVLVLIVVP
jgi:hypothetical protein